jgi:hypothetical protein
MKKNNHRFKHIELLGKENQILMMALCGSRMKGIQHLAGAKGIVLLQGIPNPIENCYV